MNGPDVYNVLRGKVSHLYHTNTVTTSCTFIQLGGLASRGHVTDLALPQTAQSSDRKDQELGLWYDVFTDTDDIHARASRRNLYGPVLFILDVDILNRLPPQSEVLVTKKNPIYWHDGEQEEARWFMSPTELETFNTTSNYGIQGTFGVMIVIRTQGGILPFPDGAVSVVIDDPDRDLTDGTHAYSNAINRIGETSHSSGRLLIANKRGCRVGCNCLKGYGSPSQIAFDQLFR